MPHYLTQIILMPEILVKEKITDTYSIHRVVYDQFPKDIGADAPRTLPLWSLSSSGVLRKVVILSPEQPRADVKQYIQKNRSFIVFPENIMNSEAFIFKVTVNPVIKRDGKLIPIRDMQSVRQWFCRQAEKNGFQASDRFVVNSISADIFEKKGHKVTINKAEISGELRVIEPEKFRNVVLNGLGRGKAFGCGLLQVIPKKTF